MPVKERRTEGREVGGNVLRGFFSLSPIKEAPAPRPGGPSSASMAAGGAHEEHPHSRPTWSGSGPGLSRSLVDLSGSPPGQKQAWPPLLAAEEPEAG